MWKGDQFSSFLISANSQRLLVDEWFMKMLFSRSEKGMEDNRSWLSITLERGNFAYNWVWDSMTEQVLRANCSIMTFTLLWHYILSINQFSNEVTANLVRIFSICKSIIVYIAILSSGFEKSCCISIGESNQYKPTIEIWVRGFHYTTYWHNFFLILIMAIPQRSTFL